MTGRELVERLAELRGRRRYAIAIAASAVAVVLVTLGMKLLDLADVPVLSLGALYVFAVLPIAVIFGRAYAIPVAVASMLRLQLLLPAAALHVHARRRRELVRARRLPRRRRWW